MNFSQLHAENEALRAEMAAWRSQAEAERAALTQRVDLEHLRADTERLRADREARRADLAVVAAEDAQARLAYLERKLFGRQSERFIDPNQQELVFITNGQDEAAAEGENDGQASSPAGDGAVETETITVTRKKRGGGGRQKIDPRLKRIDIKHTLPADQLIDPDSGEVIYEPFDTRITEKLAYTPPQLHVERHLHVKYRLIQGDGAPAERLIDSDLPEVRMAPPTTEGLPRCLAAPSLLAELLYAKYVLHLPFDRKLKDLKRQSGVTLAPASVCRWAQDVAELLKPLILLMKAQMFAHSKVIQHDDTPVNQLPAKQSKRQKCIIARFWSAVGQSDTPGAYVVYDYTDGRSREGPQAWFSDDQGQPLYTGYLQGDRYAGYDSLAGIGKGQEKWSMTLVGCWAHARRKFYDQRQNYPGDALKALSMIQGLYKIEAALRDERKEAEQAGVFDAAAWPARRQAARQAEAATEVDGFFAWCRARQAALRPKHAIRQAAEYALNQEAMLRRYLDDGILEIDNTPCERTIRPLAIGKKNWLFTGSVNAGKAAAALFSIVASAERHGINPRFYLEDLLRRLPTSTPDQRCDLLPDRWTPLGEVTPASL